MEGAAQSIAAVWSPDYLPAVLTRALTPAMCDRLIAIAESSGFARSLVYDGDGGAADEPGIRSSDTAEISAAQHREYYAVVADLVRNYNHEHCRFAINGLDALQVVRYHTGAQFRLHSDIGRKGAAHRKISLVVQLSDENSYEGGELVFGNDIVARTRGGGYIFPSWIPHEVRAVTSGVRYSLVAWAVGDYFR